METRETLPDGRVLAVLEPMEHRILLAVEAMIEQEIGKMETALKSK